MSSRLIASGLVVLGVMLGAVAIALAPADVDVPATATVQSAAATPSPSPVAARDVDVAFWEARLDAGGGYDSTLRYVDALIERARATGVLGDLERAGRALDAISTEAPADDSGLPLRRGRIAFALHDFATARSAAAQALALDPMDPAALALAADAALEMGDLDSADASYALLEEAGRRPPILSRLGRRAWLGGDTVGAEALVREAIRAASLFETGDELAFYHFQLGEMLRGRDAFADAEAEYRAALAAQPDHGPSQGGLALVLAARGDTTEATLLLEAAVARLPSPDLVAALGDLYAGAGRHDDAEDQWALVERIAELAEANGGVYDRQLALFLADHDRDPERAVDLARNELMARADVYGYDALAWASFKAGHLDEAYAAAASAMALGTPDGRIHFHAGLIAEALGRADEARRHLAFADRHRGALPPLQNGVLSAALERVGP